LRKRLGLTTLQLYTDIGGAAAKAWKVFDPRFKIAIPSSFIVDQTGHVIYRYIGENKADRPPVDAILRAARQGHSAGPGR